VSVSKEGGSAGRATQPEGLPVTIDDVRAAAGRIVGKVVRTPTALSRTLSEICGCQVIIKFENLQYTASFKERGALNKLAQLPEEARRKGVIAASAGNHAQGVAYNAAQLGIPATIVMPANTPFTKVIATERLGATIVLHGEDLAGAQDKAAEIMEEQGLTFIHPYDDVDIIAGQGTTALEMLEDRPDIETLVIPLGGGGLTAGMAVAAKALKPSIGIYGVEAELYPAMKQVLAGEAPTAGGQTIAEGIAVKRPGKLNREIIGALVDDILLVGESRIEDSVQMLLEIEKTVAEGAGAVGLAALLAYPDLFRGKTVGVVLSGGNIDARLLANILMRGLVKKGRLVRLRVEIVDQPGALAKVAQIIGDEGGNIVEVYHQRLFQNIPLKRADLDVVLETRDAKHVQRIIDALARSAFEAEWLKSELI